MSETESLILDATIGAVSQFGMRRTSMTDIAKRAGVSRQTVYNAFGNKDEIFRAAMIHMANLSEQKARQKIVQATNLSEQLDVMFEIFAIEPFKFSQNKNDSEDIFADAAIIAKDALDGFHVIVKNLYAELFKPFARQLSDKEMTPKNLADQVDSACQGLKKNARSVRHLKELLKIQKALILSVIETE